MKATSWFLLIHCNYEVFLNILVELTGLTRPYGIKRRRRSKVVVGSDLILLNGVCDPGRQTDLTVLEGIV